MDDGPGPDVVVATGNSGKLREFRGILADLPCRLCALDAFPEVVLPPEGEDYAANARAKARSAADATGRLALGDDSGLEVAALGGRPGPLSARYGGAGLDDRQRFELLLGELGALGDVVREARFVCAVALAVPAGATFVEIGICSGSILEAPRGEAGFGYDPIFSLPGDERSIAEFTEEEKDRVSHRGRALRALMPRLRAELASVDG